MQLAQTAEAAARLALSAGNRQPWRFIVVQGKEAVETSVSGAFSETSQVVRKAYGHQAHWDQSAGIPGLVAGLAAFRE